MENRAGLEEEELDKDEDDWCEDESEFNPQSMMGDILNGGVSMTALPPMLGIPQTPVHNIKPNGTIIEKIDKQVNGTNDDDDQNDY